MPSPQPPKTRISSKVKICPDTGCWLWQAAKTKRGYGLIRVSYRLRLAHRQSYEDFIGIIPDALTIDHHCKNKSCVNPNHLEVVTKRENTIRAGMDGLLDRYSQKTHCKNGHEYTADSTRITPQGWRDCRTCAREKQRARRSIQRIFR